MADPLLTLTFTPEEVARFESKVDRSAGPTGCHPWLKGQEADGYGRVWWRGRMTRAHRVAYELHTGRPAPSWADRLVLDHAIRLGCLPWRLCCNGRHLEPVTQLENTMRGRAPAKWLAYRAERQRQEHNLDAAAIGYHTERRLLLESGWPPLITWREWLLGTSQAVLAPDPATR